MDYDTWLESIYQRDLETDEDSDQLTEDDMLPDEGPAEYDNRFDP